MKTVFFAIILAGLTAHAAVQQGGKITVDLDAINFTSEKVTQLGGGIVEFEEPRIGGYPVIGSEWAAQAICSNLHAEYKTLRAREIHYGWSIPNSIYVTAYEGSNDIIVTQGSAAYHMTALVCKFTKK